MKQISEIPTNGQFVAVWVYNGHPWSGTFKINNELQLEFDVRKDKWFDCGKYYDCGLKKFLSDVSAKYFIP